MENLPEFINIAGLILDIAGACLLFLYGLPNLVSRPNIKKFSGVPVTIDDPVKEKKFKARGRIGLVSLIVGFFLQAVSSGIPILLSH